MSKAGGPGPEPARGPGHYDLSGWYEDVLESLTSWGALLSNLEHADNMLNDVLTATVRWGGGRVGEFAGELFDRAWYSVADPSPSIGQAVGSAAGESESLFPPGSLEATLASRQLSDGRASPSVSVIPRGHVRVHFNPRSK